MIIIVTYSFFLLFLQSKVYMMLSKKRSWTLNFLSLKSHGKVMEFIFLEGVGTLL